MYCSRQNCSRFLGPHVARPQSWWGAGNRTTYTCSSCSSTTCANCKTADIPGRHDCVDFDTSDRAVIRLGQQEGWSQCPGCKRMIELNMGCYHMTCLCRQQFCYLCRAPWKTCTCAQWDEGRLLVAAEERVNRRMNVNAHHHVAAPQAPPRPRQVAAVPVVARPPAVRPAVAPAPLNVADPLRSRAAPIATRPNVHNPVNVSRTPASLLPAYPVYTTQVQSRPPVTQPAYPVYTTQVQSRSPVTQPAYPVYTPPVQRRPPVTQSAYPIYASPVQRLPQPRSPTLSSNNARHSLLVPPQQTPSRTPSINYAITPYPTRPVSLNLERDRLVRRAMEELRVNHDCQHGRWSYRSGGGKCEMCSHHLPKYLFVSRWLPFAVSWLIPKYYQRCHGCEMLACNRCRKNRI